MWNLLPQKSSFLEKVHEVCTSTYFYIKVSKTVRNIPVHKQLIHTMCNRSLTRVDNSLLAKPKAI